MLTQAIEISHRLVAGQHATCHRFVFGGQRDHPFFDRNQVFRREGPLEGKIIEKPMLNHRTNRDLRFRKQFFDSISQQVRRRVADDFQPIGVFGRDDGQGAVCLDQKTGVDHFAINLARQRRLGQTRTNGGRHLSHRHRAGIVTFGAVRKCDLNHDEKPER